MALWVLERRTAPGCDEAVGFVVEAAHPTQARRLVAKMAGVEGRDYWLLPACSTCRQLKPEGKARVVLRSFLNG